MEKTTQKDNVNVLNKLGNLLFHFSLNFSQWTLIVLSVISHEDYKVLTMAELVVLNKNYLKILNCNEYKRNQNVNTNN